MNSARTVFSSLFARLPNRSVLTHRSGIVALVLAAVVLNGYWARQPLQAELSDYNRFECVAGQSGPVFKILSITSAVAEELAVQLCREPDIRKHFSSVVVAWRPRGYLTARKIVEEEYDYFWNRHHLVQGMVPNLDDYYRPLLETPRYSLYWLSQKERPELTQTFFSDKTVGLVEDAHSQSFFLQPLKSLKEAGIELRPEQKYYYRDIGRLLDAFARGEVDLISSPELAAETLPLKDGHYRLLMARDMSSGTWYLRNRWQGNDIECALWRVSREADLIFEQAPTARFDTSLCEPRA